MRCWFISDTHNQHRSIEIEGLDVVFHCGDESDAGEAWLNELEATEFFVWYTALDVKTKFYVPSNHSIAIEKGLISPDQCPSVRFLIHHQTEIDGLVVFGTPYPPEFFQWAYMKPREELGDTIFLCPHAVAAHD